MLSILGTAKGHSKDKKFSRAECALSLGRFCCGMLVELDHCQRGKSGMSNSRSLLSGVVAGAVIGCLLGLLAVVAIGGFIFWRRRR